MTAGPCAMCRWWGIELNEAARPRPRVPPDWLGCGRVEGFWPDDEPAADDAPAGFGIWEPFTAVSTVLFTAPTFGCALWEGRR